MSVTSEILDGQGRGNRLKVNGEGEAHVVVHPHPPKDETLEPLPFRQYFTLTGESSGDNDMAVDGSSTNQVFSISATEDTNIYIKYISVVIGDGGTVALNKFGSLSELTNGVSWSWFNQKEGSYELHEGIKTNLEFIRIGANTKGIGTGTDAFLADVSGGGTEKSYLPNIDTSQTFGLTWGIRLTKGTTDSINFTVKDNLTDLTTFNIVGYGIRF